MEKLKDRILNYYEAHETRIDILFFLGGFFFDVLTLTDVDDVLGIGQQLVYLLILGSILYFDFLDVNGFFKIPPRLQRIWEYRQPILHFFLGSLLSLYSLFFLKSASIFTSIVFVAVLILVMVANELKSIREKGVNIKIALFVICLFSFFSITVPVLLGFVGYIPFFLSLILTGGALYGIYHLLLKKVQNVRLLMGSLLAPGMAVLAFFFVFYMLGLIPPVPLSVQHIGIYHRVERQDGKYAVFHQNSAWSFWRNQGDKEFIAEPGDKLFVFAQIFSPARFSDSVILHWYFKDPKQGWLSTDRIPMRITGGRKEGYRGFAMKQNYPAGDWRISIETTDGREIGRIYFEVVKIDLVSPTRTWYKQLY
ncbi:hypothetical protein AZI86_09665 [Bdellovibrio bacteriovorus]|uniref:DUF2914 domain-containing protein n=1 Tax=Bdellovibrio bacteriovorus TaxID=959 RepID=A0A150WRX3_BDEBC|nr:DUF2914 domain-containing protein [Bdellovibrio bacteriovorus]KYG67261.1 hypothetical protein AZI86_09665 [Bdellovibrio bacteriovorus]